MLVQHFIHSTIFVNIFRCFWRWQRYSSAWFRNNLQHGLSKLYLWFLRPNIGQAKRGDVKCNFWRNFDEIPIEVELMSVCSSGKVRTTFLYMNLFRSSWNLNKPHRQRHFLKPTTYNKDKWKQRICFWILEGSKNSEGKLRD